MYIFILCIRPNNVLMQVFLPHIGIQPNNVLTPDCMPQIFSPMMYQLGRPRSRFYRGLTMFSRLEESFLGKKSIFHSSDSADFEDLIEDYFQIFTTEYYHFENLLF